MSAYLQKKNKMKMLSFSIVINTLNRATLLQQTLQSFRWLNYDGNFEVIVVNGPSTDNSDQIIESWLPTIRAGQCDVANLSVSRNIGICMAQGDIVVFIDDDAMPEPEWLTQLAAAYDSTEIGGAGGLVFDQTGYTYQYEYSTANRLANANWAAGQSSEHLCFPGSFEFPYLQGTNASFRRSALLEVGGFDEEIEYYLDETELCCRLIDTGYIIRQLPNAYVHHKFAPSHVRDEHRITRYRYPVIKNKIYFSLKHGRQFQQLEDIHEDNKKFSEMLSNDIDFHIAAGRLDKSERGVFKEENKQAWDRGVEQGLSDECELITTEKINKWKGSFLSFETLIKPDCKVILLISRDFPPDHGGGIATFNKDLAEILASKGNLVHVITSSPDINRVDFENGVWVHRMQVTKKELTSEASDYNVPQHIWDWSVTALNEAKRISTHRRIDIIEAPIWDCEGIAFLLNGKWPLATSLQTTLHFWLDSHPEYKNNDIWMQSFGSPMLAIEKHLMQSSEAIRSISRAIKNDIEAAYNFKFDKKRLHIAPLGMPDTKLPPSIQTQDTINILFVGRLEHRKGIDVLLKAIPAVLAKNKNIHFQIIGDDTLLKPEKNITYKDEFHSIKTNNQWLENIEFMGRVNDEALKKAYNTCDLFVAPSRFESFGLVFLEAMRESKPVIGCTAGGIPEIIQNETNGLLIPPGEVYALTKAILLLAESDPLRKKMGLAGKNIFINKFTSDVMFNASIKLFNTAQENYGTRI